MQTRAVWLQFSEQAGWPIITSSRVRSNWVSRRVVLKFLFELGGFCRGWGSLDREFPFRVIPR